jgi:deazaflavin-dependent oxidoreductase (nitroreductase family)
MSHTPPVRRFRNRVVNPAMARIAGRRYWYTALLHHTGRRSGKTYATPLTPMRVSDGLLIALPFGSSVDWLRNLQSTGRATLQLRGDTFEVGEPVLTDAATALQQLPVITRTLSRWIGANDFVKLKRLS